jgi:hypothetical protein
VDVETRDLLSSSLQQMMAEESDRPLAQRLMDLGWDEVLADDAPTALRTLFEVKGETLSSGDVLGPLLAQAVTDGAGMSSLTDSSLLLPSSFDPGRLSSQVAGDELVIEGVLLARPGPDATIVVPVDGAGRIRLAVVRAKEAKEMAWTEAAGTDRDLGLVRTVGRTGASAATWIDGEQATAGWDAGITLGRWSLAAELVGLARHVVAEAVAYTGERKQYGRPIGSFQALQHRLAAAYASMIGASQLVAEAASSGSSWVALVAKAMAGHAAEDCCTQAQQAYGAIGFTWEHPFHRSLRRMYMLDRLFGGWRQLEFEIGIHLQQASGVPRIGTL